MLIENGIKRTPWQAKQAETKTQNSTHTAKIHNSNHNKTTKQNNQKQQQHRQAQNHHTHHTNNPKQNKRSNPSRKGTRLNPYFPRSE